MQGPLDARQLGIAWALVSATGSALFVIPWKLANEAGDPATSTLILLVVAAFANSLLVIGQRAARASLRFHASALEVAVALLLAFFTLLGNLSSARAIVELSPALMNVMLRSEVLFVAVFAWIFLGERVERRYWLGAALAAVGLWILQGPGGVGGGFDFEFASFAKLGAGTGMALSAAACFSALSVITRRFVQRMDLVIVNSIRLWFAVLLWFAFNAPPVLSELPWDQVKYASMSAVVGPFLGRLALMISSRYVEARVSALANLTAPAMTLLLAYFVLGDWPATFQIVGGVIMIAGIAIPLAGGLRRAT